MGWDGRSSSWKIVACSIDIDRLAYEAEKADGAVEDDPPIVDVEPGAGLKRSQWELEEEEGCPNLQATSSNSGIHAPQASDCAEQRGEGVACTPVSVNHSNKRRAKKRKAEKEKNGQYPRSTVFERYVQGAAVISNTLDFSALGATVGGYSGKRKPVSGVKTVYSKGDLLEKQGFKEVKWDGM